MAILAGQAEQESPASQEATVSRQVYNNDLNFKHEPRGTWLLYTSSKWEYAYVYIT